MPTSVHIPKPLLVAVDRKARALRVSRNKLIIQALEREVAQPAWSPDLFERLLDVDDDVRADVDEMMTSIRDGRRSKRAPKL